MEHRKWALGVALAFCACATSKSSKAASEEHGLQGFDSSYANDVTEDGASPVGSGPGFARSYSHPNNSGTAANSGGPPLAPAASPAPQPECREALRSSASNDASAKSDEHSLSGTVVRVSRDAVRIRTADKSVHVLRIVPRTQICVAGAARLEEGRLVRASYAQQNGRDTATRIAESAGPTNLER